MKTEFLIQMQNFKEFEILVLGATNRPFEIDSAVIRRFEKRIYIPLPDLDSRIKILKMNCKNTNHNLNDLDWKEIGEKTKGYSGSDLFYIVRNTVMEPIRMIMNCKYWKKVGEFYEIILKGDENVIIEDYRNIPMNQIKIPILTKEHFLKTLETTKSSICLDEIGKFEEFTNLYQA